MKKPHFIPFIFLFLLASCADDDTAPTLTGDRKVIQDFVDADPDINAVFIADIDMYKMVIEVDSTKPLLSSGTIVLAYYTIKDLDGLVIDISNATNGGPAKMLIGESAIYPIGFDVALLTMREGERSRFFIPSDQAYGDFMLDGLIKKRAILDVEIEVVGTLSFTLQAALEASDIEQFIRSYSFNDGNSSDRLFRSIAGGVRYRIIQPLDSGASASVGEQISIRYIGRFLNGTPFKATSGSDVFKYKFASNEVISGLDKGIGQMLKGERALILMPSSEAYGASAKVMPQFIANDLVALDIIPEYAAAIGPFKPLMFEVHLLP